VNCGCSESIIIKSIQFQYHIKVLIFVLLISMFGMITILIGLT